MQKLTKKLSLVMVALFTVFTVLSYIPAKAAVVPKLQMAAQPSTEYKVGDRITFNVTSPNYGGKVEYRVICYNGTTKTTTNLWQTPSTGYYYKGWQPSGNFSFPITWVVTNKMQPGAYSLTVLVRRVGAKVAYDSHIDTKAFWVKDAAATVESIAPVADVTVNEGTAAVLPAEVTLNLTDKTTKTAKVTWAAVDTTKVGTVAVEGTVEGTTLKAKVNVAVKAVAITAQVKATGAKKLEVTFNKAIDSTKAVFAVKKSIIAVNYDKVVVADDKKSAVITTTTDLTLGDYTVSVTGLADTAIAGTVSVQDVKVSKINITSTTAPRLSGNKTAQVSYQVLNQYGEKMAINTINWTISTGVGASSDTNTAGDGTFVITAANTLDFVPGAVVYITGVHATTGTVVNAQVTVALNSTSDKVVFKGVCDTTTGKLVSLPAGFANGRYVMLYEVLDQYGTKIASPTFSDLVFISNNPLFVGSTFTQATPPQVTVEGVVYEAVDLTRGTNPNNGGSVTIQAISKLTGKISTIDTQANALAAVKSFTMSAPAKMVSEGETVEIPFTAVDQYGNAVTKHSLLNGHVTLASGLAFVQQDDGSTKLMFTAPTTGAADGIDLPVYLTSLVTAGGNFSSLMVSVRETARPVAIVGIDAAKVTSVAKGNYVDIYPTDLSVQDQYGRTMADADVTAWIDDVTPANSIVVASSIAGTTPFTVKLNGAGSDAVSQVLAASTSYVRIEAIDVLAATENISFTLATANDGTGLVAASTKVVTYTKVVQSEYVSYTVDNLGTMYNDNAATKTAAAYDKTLKVYGVKADGTKVLLPYADYTVTTDGQLLVTNNVISDDADANGVITGYAPTDFLVDSKYADVKVSVLVTVKDASGAAAAIIEKELLVSNKTPKVATVTFDKDLVTNGKAVIASGAIAASDINAFVYEILDQYGIDQTATTADIDPTITITNLTKVSGSTFTVTGNGSTTTSIANATMGDKFTVTYKYASGVKVTVEFTVGL